MTIKERITSVCEDLGRLRNARFIGYNTKMGSRMYGTLANVPCIETPCAENLMVGMAIGMGMHGTTLPVLCFERHEFVLFALGTLAVMGDKFHSVTGEKVRMVVRAIKGGSKPLNAGAQHTGDYTEVIELACSNSIIIDQSILTTDLVLDALTLSPSGIVIIMEDRDGYDNPVATEQTVTNQQPRCHC